jgi:predicted nucleic acid-binding protein
MDVTPGRFVLDTNTVLYLLGGRLAHPLLDGTYFLSVISDLELLAYPELSLSLVVRSLFKTCLIIRFAIQ